MNYRLLSAINENIEDANSLSKSVYESDRRYGIRPKKLRRNEL